MPITNQIKALEAEVEQITARLHGHVVVSRCSDWAPDVYALDTSGRGFSRTPYPAGGASPEELAAHGYRIVTGAELDAMRARVIVVEYQSGDIPAEG